MKKLIIFLVIELLCLLSVVEGLRSCRHCSLGPPPPDDQAPGAHTSDDVVQSPRRFFFTNDDLSNSDLAFSQLIGYYGILYDTQQEFAQRKAAFQANLDTIKTLNDQQINAGGEPVFGISPFLDFSPHEFRQLYLGLPPHNISERRQVFSPTYDQEEEQEPVELPPPIPTTVTRATLTPIDWRSQNAITKVRDQGQCGSCWAHSAVEAIESFYFLKQQRNSTANGAATMLSVQMLLGCTYGSYDGCNGGWPADAMQAVINRGGIVSEQSYPYTSWDGVTCKFGNGRVPRPIATIRSHQTSPYGSLGSVLQQVGPPSVCLCSQSLQYYRGGVMRSCCREQDHCVQAVGIGKNSNMNNGLPYWILKNSWGSAWGDKGYFYLDATVESGNLCGVQEQIDVPVV